MKNFFYSLFFISVLAGCPEKKMTPDPVPVDEPKVESPVESAVPDQSRLTYDDLMGYEGRLAPQAGPNLYVPLYLLADSAFIDISNSAS